MVKRIFLFITVVFTLQNCIISNPQPEDCEVRTIVVSSIIAGSDYDIFFTSKKGDRYYINRGLEQGLTLKSLKKIALNQEATLHLPKFALTGVSTHIAQLEINDRIIYTEFD